MTSVGVKRVTTMVEGIVYDKPAIVRLIAPLADVDVVVREESVMLLHEACHAWAYSCGVDDGFDT